MRKMNGAHSLGATLEGGHCWLNLISGGKVKVWVLGEGDLGVINLALLSAMVAELILCPDCGNWYSIEEDDEQRHCPYCVPEKLEDVTGVQYIPSDDLNFEGILVHFHQHGCGVVPGEKSYTGDIRQRRPGVYLTAEMAGKLAHLLAGVVQCVNCGAWFRIKVGSPVVCPACDTSYEEEDDEHERTGSPDVGLGGDTTGGGPPPF